MADMSMLSSLELREVFDRFSGLEQERKDATSRLLDELDSLRTKHQVAYDDFDRERKACRILQEEMRELKAKTDRRGFVAVLIDADSDDYMFREKFLNNGVSGGTEAAKMLFNRIIDHLKSIKMDTESLDVVVRAFANLHGLQSACRKKGLLDTGKNLEPFIHGFTQCRGLFDFVDVGQGKEKADFKIKECLDLFVNNYQCKHIVVGVCHDAGYAPYLSNYASDLTKRDKISLLEGGRMNHSFRNFKFPHGPFKLPEIFEPPLRNEDSSNLLLPNGGIRVAMPANQPVEKRPELLINDKAKGFADKLKPMRDSDGKRIDRVLKVDPDGRDSSFLRSLKSANLCWYYYLRGHCDLDCGKKHMVPPLTSHEFDCLWFVARQAGQCHKTRNGDDCVDPLCIYRHSTS